MKIKLLFVFFLSAVSIFAANASLNYDPATGALKPLNGGNSLIIPNVTILDLSIPNGGIAGTALDDTIARVSYVDAQISAISAGSLPIGMAIELPSSATPGSTLILADGNNGTTAFTARTNYTAYQQGYGTVATPTVNVAAGTYSSAQNVVASTTTPNATLRYTFGSSPADPTASDTAVSGAINVSETGVLKLRGFGNLWKPSEVLSTAYTISLPPTESSAYVAAVLADSPLAYWRLNDSAPSGAGSVTDFSTAGTYDATPNGGLTWDGPGSISDGLGKSVLGNGTSGYISAGSSLATTLMSSSTWTIEAWFYSSVANAGFIFSAASDATHRVAIQHYANRIYSSSTVGGNKSGLVSQLTGNWHHIVLTSTGALYINNVEAVGTSSAPLNSTVAATIGALNNATSWFNGRLADVAVYTTVLSPARIAAHWEAAHDHVLASGQTWGMTMASSVPELYTPGSDITGSLDNSASFADDGGVNVLEVGGGTFRSITFDNPTSFNQWAPFSGGTMELEFKYSGTLGTWMLGQITGKDRLNINDTNDSIKLFINSSGGQMQYNYNNGGTIVSAAATTTLSPNTWYTARIKWRTSGTPTISITINGVEATSSTTILNPNCLAWHHLLIGNDTNTTPTSLRIRNVKIYGSWQN